MESTKPTFGSEPIAITEAVRLVIAAAVVCLTAFNAWNPTEEQITSIFGLYAAVSILLSVLARSRSTPTSRVAMTNDQAAVLTAAKEVAAEEAKNQPS